MLYKENGDETIVRKKREATKFNQSKESKSMCCWFGRRWITVDTGMTLEIQENDYTHRDNIFQTLKWIEEREQAWLKAYGG